MTNVRIYKHNDLILKVECIGHSGYAEKGEDIVCAGLSSVVQTAMLGLLNVAKINIKLKRDEEIGFLSFAFENKKDETDQISQAILKTMLCGISDLYESYSDFIKLEVIDNVY